MINKEKECLTVTTNKNVQYSLGNGHRLNGARLISTGPCVASVHVLKAGTYQYTRKTKGRDQQKTEISPKRASEHIWMGKKAEGFGY